MPDLPLTGACACGRVRFAISEPLLTAGYCHCTRCQRRTGCGASAGAACAPGSFAITAGEELVRAWDPGGGGNLKAFCSACGGAVYSQAPDDASRVSVRLGAIDGDPGIRPSWRQHVASAAVWEALPDDGLPRYDGPRPG